jgi:hypothetical protein
VLLDDAIRLAANAGRDDVEVRLQVAPEGTHVFQFQFGALDTARTVNRWHGPLAVEMIEDRQS